MCPPGGQELGVPASCAAAAATKKNRREASYSPSSVR